MAAEFVMPPNGAFEASVVKLCQLNELTSFLNPWVITPVGWRIASNRDMHPVTTALIYAVLEAALTFGVHHWAFQPWMIFLWISPFHLFISWIHMDIFQTLRYREEHSLPYAGSSEEQRSLPNTTRGVSSGFFLLGPIVTAAANNAVLVLFAQCLQAPSRFHQHPDERILEISATLLFLSCRFADFFIWRRTRRGGLPESWQSLLLPLYSQALLFVVRASLRWISGFSPLLGLQMLDAIGAEQNFGLQRYEWIKEQNWKPAFWVHLGVLVVIYVEAFTSTHFRQRAVVESK